MPEGNGTSPNGVAGAERDRVLLEVEGLSVSYRSAGPAAARAVRDVSFGLRRGEALGIVGESGSGKSTVLRAMMRLLSRNALVSSGSIRLEGSDLLTLSDQEMARMRGTRLGMVFQDPVNVLNPSFTVGSQLERVLRLHRPDIAARDRPARVLEMLARVGIDGRDKLKSYPFEFSQGQLQRIAIAAACLGGPIEVLLADEPTTSLDVTIEAQIMAMLDELRAELHLAIVLVSHDIALVAEHCDRILVMYAGHLVEDGATADVVASPQHPYTRELLRAVPELDGDYERLYSMRGELRGLATLTAGCPFAQRCPSYLGSRCDDERPELRRYGSTRVACHAVAPALGAAGPAAADSTVGAHARSATERGGS